ncbi:hypothetical protein NDU88_002391 [Pleurodeles waltl]|uniref:Uncharacterized protein n=1 Tax=Pleurodeles waltl TaxID=8319 RepID=A0AAV7NHV1_PLEWA|nr:hypothetical protein NDU88_002391 [Pleurodeles waltl]
MRASSCRHPRESAAIPVLLLHGVPTVTATLIWQPDAAVYPMPRGSSTWKSLDPGCCPLHGYYPAAASLPRCPGARALVYGVLPAASDNSSYGLCLSVSATALV